MRNIRSKPCYGIAASVAVAHRTAKTALGFCLAVTYSCLGVASAQLPAQTLAPTASGSGNGSMVTFASTSGRSLSDDSNIPTVDASYSLLNDYSSVQPASYTAPGAMAYQGGNVCGAGCDVNYYVNVEALYLRREDDSRFSLSRSSFIEDWEFELGGRYTVGNLENCVDGWEATYVGNFEWSRFGSATGAGTLQSRLLPLNGFTANEVSAFNNADAHVQAYEARMQSFEVNRRWWTWDVLSTMIGVRYVDYEEDYRFFSSRSGTGIGVLSESVDNQMLGLQAGGDLLYPISLRGNVGFRGKAGVYANFDERATFLSNAGTTVVNSGDTDVKVAGLFEFGVIGNYHILPSVRLTAGYEFWYMPGLATVPEQGPALVSPAMGTTVFNEDDVILHGGSAGIQILF